MRIEQSSQVYQGYQKSTALSASSKTFGQVMAETSVQDRYVPSAPAPRTETEFSVKERTYYGSVTVNNATQAKLKQLAELNAQADYAGMSSEEIYVEIWNRYDEAFDGNMVAITACIAGPVEWNAVNTQFVDEINHRVFFPEIAARVAAGKADVHTPEEEETLKTAAHKDANKVFHSALIKVLGYEGMNFEERETAIREKYAGKDTLLDFLKMQSELQRSGVLEHKMGKKADTYCAMLGIELENALNPNSLSNVGFEKASDLTPEQWNRALSQPFDTAKFAVAMKENLSRISVINGYTADIEKMMADCIDRFVSAVVDDSLDSLLSEAKQ